MGRAGPLSVLAVNAHSVTAVGKEVRALSWALCHPLNPGKAAVPLHRLPFPQLQPQPPNQAQEVAEGKEDDRVALGGGWSIFRGNLDKRLHRWC
jgi:hypothetical protein